LLSDLSFGSFLSYSPHGSTPEEQASVATCRAIKDDGFVQVDETQEPILAYAARRLQESLTPELEQFLSPDAVLVPMPGHAPLLPRQPHVLWVPRRICEELLRVGLGARMAPFLVRQYAVPKSSWAPSRQRPSAEVHHNSLGVVPHLGDPPQEIVLVDDVITKGSTLLAGATRLSQAFPFAFISAFALVRTQNATNSGKDKQIFRAIVDPIVSRITLSKYGAWRRDP
jgi:hypothetical protein